MDQLVAVGRKSPQNSMWLPAMPVPYGWIRVPCSGRRQTLIYIWSLPLALSLDGVPFPIHPQSFVCHSYLRIYGDAEDSRESEKRSEGKSFGGSPLLSSTLFFLFFPTPDLTPSLSSPPSGRPTKRAAVSI